MDTRAHKCTVGTFYYNYSDYQRCDFSLLPVAMMEHDWMHGLFFSRSRERTQKWNGKCGSPEEVLK